MNEEIVDLRDKKGEELLDAYNDIALTTINNLEKNNDKDSGK